MVATLTPTRPGVSVADATAEHALPRSSIVRVSAPRLAFRDYGGTGRPVVLLHGLASSATIWDAVGPVLARNHQVVALDQRGHGASQKPDSGYDFATVASDLSGFIQALGMYRPVIVGHSWGAHVALEFAARRPNQTSGIVLVDGGFEALDGKSWEHVERDMAPPDLTHLTPPELLAQVKEWEWGEFWSDYVEREVLSLFDVAKDGTVRPRLSKANHFRILRAVWEQNLPQTYAQVRAPARLISVLPPGISEAEARRKRAQVEFGAAALSADAVWFEQTYHDVPLQRPNELAGVISEFVGLGQDKPVTKPSADGSIAIGA